MKFLKSALSGSDEIVQILAAMPQATVHFGRNREVTFANLIAHDILGFDPTGIDWFDLAEVIEMRNPDGSRADGSDFSFEQVLQGMTLPGKKYILQDAQRQEHVVIISASPAFSNGRISGIISFWQDITDRERLVGQLELEQSRLRTMIENAPEGIIVADEEGRLVSANPAAEELFKRPLPYGQDYPSLADLQICYSNGSPYDPRYIPLVCSALDGEPMKNIELQVQHPDGNRIWLLVSTAPIIDSSGNLNGSVGIFKDISARKLSEQALRQQASHSRLLAVLSKAFAESGLNYQELLDTIVNQINETTGDLCSLQISVDEENLSYPPSSLELPETASLLNMPMWAHGHRIGTMQIIRLQPESHFDDDDYAFFHDLAGRAALALENARLFEREARQARELQALNQAASALLSTLDLEALLKQILDSAHLAIPAAQQGFLFLYDETSQTLAARAMFGCSDPSRIPGEVLKLAHATNRDQLSTLQESPLHFQDRQPEGGEVSPPVVLVPLRLEQRGIGVLAFTGPFYASFTASDMRLLESFAATATAALQNAILYSEVQRLATTDAVTGQYNRHKLIELGELEMQRFHRYHNPLAAIMIDIDYFKEINDQYGHHVGDIVLRSVAGRIRATIRNIDILGRYGGDEFAILLPYVHQGEAREIAERVYHSITSQPVAAQGSDIPLTISLGVAEANEQVESLIALLNQADSALYLAKQGGRNRVSTG